MSKKHKVPTKVKLPTDIHGQPIDIGCMMRFGEECIRIDSLTYYGTEFDNLGYRWVANEEEFDNLAGGEVIWRPRET